MQNTRKGAQGRGLGLRLEIACMAQVDITAERKDPGRKIEKEPPGLFILITRNKYMQHLKDFKNLSALLIYIYFFFNFDHEINNNNNAKKLSFGFPL